MKTHKLSRATTLRLLGGFVVVPPALALLGIRFDGHRNRLLLAGLSLEGNR